MKKLFTLLFGTGLVTAASATTSLTTLNVIRSITTFTGADSTPVAPAYHYQVFKQSDNSFGYDVYLGTKKIIHQQNIPGQPGNSGFTTKEAATKVAGFVTGKLQKNIFPPTVSNQELKQLQVL